VNTLPELKKKFGAIWPFLDERMRRLMVGNEAKVLGWGGVSLVHRACGLSRKAILKGIREIEAGETWQGRIRRPGAGRKPITISDPQVVSQLEAMIDETTRGNPESPLLWTCMSTRAISAALSRNEHPISHTKVGQILHDLNYSLQSNRKTEEGDDHPDRDAQFRHINRELKRYLARGWPVISVDTKKKGVLQRYERSSL
jgi:Rhodopirellula transposase DDE domain